jgi:hypothetical protein
MARLWGRPIACKIPGRQPVRLPYSSKDPTSILKCKRVTCYAPTAQLESRGNFASNGIHASKLLQVALIIARN